MLERIKRWVHPSRKHKVPPMLNTYEINFRAVGFMGNHYSVCMLKQEAESASAAVDILCNDIKVMAVLAPHYTPTKEGSLMVRYFDRIISHDG